MCCIAFLYPTDIIRLAHHCFGFTLRSWLCFILLVWPLPPTVWCCSTSGTSLRYRGWAPDSTGSCGYHASLCTFASEQYPRKYLKFLEWALYKFSEWMNERMNEWINEDDKMTREALVLADSVSSRTLQSYALHSMLWNNWYRMSWCSHYCLINLK